MGDGKPFELLATSRHVRLQSRALHDLCDDTAILRTALVKCISRTNVSHFHVVLEGLSLAVHSASLHLPCSSLRVPQTAHEKE